MFNQLQIAIAQLNFTVGDISGNSAQILQAITHARDTLAADLIVFPELALTGYPPEDLLLRADFLAACQLSVDKIVAASQGIDVLLGLPQRLQDKLYNSAIWIIEQQIQACYHKQHLPNYGIFDEKRYFSAGNQNCVIDYKGLKTGLLICEDLWYPEPLANCVAEGAQFIISIHASPFDQEKIKLREKLIVTQAQTHRIPIMYVNQVGGQDELVFDGNSMTCNAQGEICQQAPQFIPSIELVTISPAATSLAIHGKRSATTAPLPTLYDALVLATQDYIHKNGFQGALLGLSGGIDSALSLCIAVDALGADQVEAILLPSRYTSDMSLEDALTLAHNLAVKHTTISIEPMFQAYLSALTDSLTHAPLELAQQNLQARCRGTLLMGLSNHTGKLLLSTGNKSELAVGYCTLYGDMAGAFAPLKDVYKNQVVALANYRNQLQPVIPRRIIDRPPSAELAFNQTDADNIPAYDILDPILEQYLEQDAGLDEIMAQGFAANLVKQVITLVNRAEYKRRQAPPGVRVTPRAFGKDRRYPITSRFLAWDPGRDD